MYTIAFIHFQKNSYVLFTKALQATWIHFASWKKCLLALNPTTQSNTTPYKWRRNMPFRLEARTGGVSCQLYCANCGYTKYSGLILSRTPTDVMFSNMLNSAAAEGWTVAPEDNEICPECTKKAVE